MKVKQQIINFYQILKELPDNEEYNVEGIVIETIISKLFAA